MAITALTLAFCLRGVCADLGASHAELKARYRKELRGTMFSKEYGVKVMLVSAFSWRPNITRADLRLVNDRVEYVEYRGSDEGFPLATALQLLSENSAGYRWWTTLDASGGGIRAMSFERSDGAKAHAILSDSGGSVTLISAKWIEIKKAYEALPWYKKLF